MPTAGDPAQVTCGECGGPLPPPVRVGGRPRITCSDACRQSRRRRRKALESYPGGWESVAGPMLTGSEIPDDPLTHRRQVVESVLRVIEGGPAAAATDQLSAALLEAQGIVYGLRRLERDLPARLAGRAGQLARDIGRSLRRNFGEIASVEEERDSG